MSKNPRDLADRPKFYQSSSFKALEAEWKAKLASSGFEDIESDESTLKQYASSDFAKRPEYDQSKEEYYRLAGHFLHEYHFRDSRGSTWQWKKQVWELHAEGKSIREIIKLLDPEGKEPFGTMFKKIQQCLSRLAKVMVQKCQKQQNP